MFNNIGKVAATVAALAAVAVGASAVAGAASKSNSNSSQGAASPAAGPGYGPPPAGAPPAGAPPQGNGAPPQGNGAPPRGNGAPPRGNGAPPRGRPPQGRPPRGARFGQHKPETPLTGDVAAKVRAAAQAKVPGGTIERVETDSDHGSPYEAHVRKPDGTELEVLVNKSFEVTAVNTMRHP
jgi:hypothetical protein